MTNKKYHAATKHVLVKPLEQEVNSKVGLILSPAMADQNPGYGEVLSVGFECPDFMILDPSFGKDVYDSLNVPEE